MRILNRSEVQSALPMADAITAMRWAYLASSIGEAKMPSRVHLDLPEAASVALFMPAFVAAKPDGTIAASLAVKAITVIPQNSEHGLPLIQGAVLVFHPQTGQCLALLDGAALTAIRTGAGSGVATDLLARPDAATAAVFGAGPQAETQLEAVCAVRPIQTVWIHNRTRSRAESLVAKLRERPHLPEDIRIAQTAREAVREADIVCTATGAHAPLFADADLKPGAHINAIGSFRREMQELSPETVQRARLFVDNREAALSEAGDLLQALASGHITESHLLGEVGDLLSGSVAGRLTAADLTLFKSVGMATQDAVAASFALARAEAEGLGQCVAFTGVD